MKKIILILISIVFISFSCQNEENNTDTTVLSETNPNEINENNTDASEKSNDSILRDEVSDNNDSLKIFYAKFINADIVEGITALHFIKDSGDEISFTVFDIDPEKEGLFTYKESENSFFPELITNPKIKDVTFKIYLKIEKRDVDLVGMTEVEVLKKIEKVLSSNNPIKLDYNNFCEDFYPFIEKIDKLLKENSEVSKKISYKEINTYLKDLPENGLISDSLILIDECSGEEIRKICYDYRMEYGSSFNIYARDFVFCEILPGFKGIYEESSKEDVKKILGNPVLSCNEAFVYQSDIEEDELNYDNRWSLYIIFENNLVKAFYFKPNFDNC